MLMCSKCVQKESKHVFLFAAMLLCKNEIEKLAIWKWDQDKYEKKVVVTRCDVNLYCFGLHKVFGRINICDLIFDYP